MVSPAVPLLQSLGDGLWWVVGDAGEPCSVYVVLPPDQPFSGTTLYDSWSVSGWYVMVPNPLTPPYDDFVSWVRAELALASGTLWHVVAWVDWPTAQAVAVIPISGSQNALRLSTLPGRADIVLGGSAFQLNLGNSSALPVTMTADCALVVTQGLSPIVYIAGQSPVVLVPQGLWTVTIPLAGRTAGSASMPFAAMPDNLLAIDAGWAIRYFLPGGVAQTWTFLASSATYAPFVAAVHPLLPLDATQTRLAVDFNTSYPVSTAPPAGPSLYSTDGLACPLVAKDTGEALGFALCAAPCGAEYLAPFGAWTLSTGIPASAVRLMPGLFAGESLLLAPDDQIAFVTGCPAYAAGWGPGGSPSPGFPLTSQATTAWVAVMPGTADAPRWYFCQASASTFYGNPVEGAFPVAIDARLSPLTQGTAFPMVPYAGLVAYTSDVPTFESQVLVAARHALLGQPAGGPIFVRAGEAAPSSDLDCATNIEGMVIDLTDGGAIASLTLALSAPGAFGWPTGVPAVLANALTLDQAVMVLGPPAAALLPALQPLLAVGAFQFSALPVDGAFIVLKLNNTITLRELVTRTDLWHLPDILTGDVSAAASALQCAIDQADAGASLPGAPFTLFLQLLDDPDWTGTLVFGAQAQAQSLPPDLQMLLGGIDGPLRAHHLGVQGSRVAPSGSSSAFSVMSSSLFGVIDYQRTASATPATLDYEVETLIVVFADASVAQFNVTVDLTLGSLFGRQMRLLSPFESPGVSPNSVRASGQYQLIDGVATVTFATREPFVFGIPPCESPAGPLPTRIVEQVVITGASLAPVQRSGSPAIVQARFALEGEVWFNPAPFPSAPELDLFSYGTPGAGLPFSGLDLAVAFEILADGTVADKKVTLDYSQLTLTPTPEILRCASLLWCLPLRLSAFRWSETGLSASSLGAQTLTVLDLDVATGTPQSTGTLASTRPSPLSTSQPMFVLEYDLPLGSLGALSSANVELSASLYVGWGPSALTPANDAAALLVKLPQLSGGYGGFTLQGVLKLTYGDANLLQVDVKPNERVYALLFSNIQLSLFGFTFPPGVLVDALVFAGQPQSNSPSNGNNIAWLVAAKQT